MNILTICRDLLTPPHCHACGARTARSNELFCSACMLHLPFTRFAETPTDNKMAHLFWGRACLQRAAALVYYTPGGKAARPLLALKYQKEERPGVLMGHLMAESMLPHHFFQDVDILLPVPLTPQRQQLRGYNQSSLIAKGISEATGLPVENNAVIRQHFEVTQTQKNYAERTHNVTHAFQLMAPERLEGKHILLIDDICTTGSTLTALAELIHSIPNTRISAATYGFSLQ